MTRFVFLQSPWLRRAVLGLAALSGLGAAALLVATAVVYPTLPDLDVITHYQPKQPLRVLTADGVEIAGFGAERRVYQRIGGSAASLHP